MTVKERVMWPNIFVTITVRQVAVPSPPAAPVTQVAAPAVETRPRNWRIFCCNYRTSSDDSACEYSVTRINPLVF